MPQPTPPPPDDPAAPRRAGVPAPRTPPVAGRSPGEATGDPHPVVALLAAVTDVGADRAPARPVVVLVTSPRATDGPPVSASVHAVLDAASPRIPHALVDPADHDDDLRRLLDAAVRQFERPRAGWPPLPFPRYRDVATIADLRLPAHGVDRRVGALRAALGPGAGGSARVTEPIVSILTAGGTGASLAAGQAGGPRLATALYYVGVALLAAVLVLATRRLRQVLGPLWRLRRVHRALTDGDGGSALAAATTWTADAVDSAPDPDTARADRDRALAAVPALQQAVAVAFSRATSRLYLLGAGIVIVALLLTLRIPDRPLRAHTGDAPHVALE
ncbi:MAG TPA: hypothetical protein VFY17_08455 [Pilimelia sp.]|nr:hypothetical protein [Pilimelia sp.]